MNKYYGENTLDEQKLIKDESGKMSVSDVAQKAGVTIDDFVRYEVGRG